MSNIGDIIDETVERGVNFLSRHPIKTSTAAGILGGAGFWTFMEPAAAESIGMFAESAAPYKDLAITSAAMGVGSGSISAILLGYIKNSGGFHNAMLKAAYAYASPENKKFIVQRLSECRDEPRLDILSAAHMLEDGEVDLAVEHIRRATSSLIRSRFATKAGNAVFKLSLYDRFSDFEVGLLEELNSVCERAVEFSNLDRDEWQNLGSNNDCFFPDYVRAVQAANVLISNIDALEALSSGDVDQADDLLRKLVVDDPSIVNGCVYGSFLDALAPLDDDIKVKSDEHWSSLITDIVESPKLEEQFIKIPGSKNEVLESGDNETKRNMIIVKRGEPDQGLENEHLITQFLYDMIGQKGIVPEALALHEHDGKIYFFQKRHPGETLFSAVQDGNVHELFERFAVTLDEYQRAVQRNQRAASKYGVPLSKVLLPREYQSKFVSRLQADVDGMDLMPLLKYTVPIFAILNKQRQGGYHGDLNTRNVIVHNKGMCIIDPEKLSLGPRILDWAKAHQHSEIEAGVDTVESIDIGYEIFRKRSTSKDEYHAIYNCAAFFTASHMSGTLSKYLRNGGISREVGEPRFLAYLEEAIHTLELLDEAMPRRSRQNMERLLDTYSTIHDKMLQRSC